MIKNDQLQPGLSVIIPIYNVEQYVKKSILSVFESKIQNLRIIAVDDHGSDRSIEIVKELAKHDPRIEIIHNDRNRGLAFSRNHGIKFVKTTHLAFLDSDDWVAPGFYDRLMEMSIKENADISTGQVIYTYPETGIKREEWVSWWSFHSGKKLLSSPEEKQDIIYACACWNKVYRTSFIRNNDISFPVDLFIEDVPFTFLATALANKITLVKEAELYYRQRSNSIMKDLKTSKRVFDVFKIMDICYQRLNLIHEDLQPIYKQILDHFWIFNLHSWSTAVCDQDYDIFLKELKARYRLIDITNNPFITPEHIQIYKDTLNLQDFYRIFLFGKFPLKVTISPNSWITQ